VPTTLPTVAGSLHRLSLKRNKFFNHSPAFVLVSMRLIRQVDYATLLKIFAEENAVKDSWTPDNPDDWPRARFVTADKQFGGVWVSTN